MTVHVFWRHADYPTDPFTNIGQCAAVEIDECLLPVPGQSVVLDGISVRLRDFSGRRPPKDLKPFVNPQVLPMGCYQLIFTKDRRVATIAKAIGLKGQAVLMACESAGSGPIIEWCDRSDLSGDAERWS